MAFVVALLLSIVFMYLVLAGAIRVVAAPHLDHAGLPLTVPFALLSILIFGGSINIFSGLGLFVLFGIVKKNSILQVDHTNQLRSQGKARLDAILEANPGSVTTNPDDDDCLRRRYATARFLPRHRRRTKPGHRQHRHWRPDVLTASHPAGGAGCLFDTR